MDLIYACHVKNEHWGDLINYNLSKIIDDCNNVYIVYSVARTVKSDVFKKSIVHTKVRFIEVENNGYDFKKYKSGLLSLNVKANHDWTAYLNRYSDLKAAFGNDICAAKKHWSDHGKAEGRICQSETKKSVILMNDSFIFSRNIDDIMKNIRDKINDKTEFIGLSRSDEHKQHYQSYFWVLNYNLVPILCDFLTKDRLDDSAGSNNIIMNCEVDLSNRFINRYKSDCIYHTNSENLMLDSLVTLLNDGYPIIKLQCLKRVKYDSNVDIRDFVPERYKALHNDLKHMSDEELSAHFFRCGIFEGRKYKFNQIPYIPQSIKTLLDNTGLCYYNFIS